MLSIKPGKRGILLAVRVMPRSSRNELAGVYGEAIKVRLTAPPVEGAANQALVEFIAELLRVRKAQIEIVAGQSSRDKTLCISGVDEAEVRARLCALLGSSAR